MTFKLNQSSASTSVVPSEAKQLISFLSSIILSMASLSLVACRTFAMAAWAPERIGLGSGTEGSWFANLTTPSFGRNDEYSVGNPAYRLIKYTSCSSCLVQAQA